MAAVGALLVTDELARLALDAALEPNLLVTEVTERRARELDVYKAVIRRLLRAVTKIGEYGLYRYAKIVSVCIRTYTCVYHVHAYVRTCACTLVSVICMEKYSY